MYLWGGKERSGKYMRFNRRLGLSVRADKGGMAFVPVFLSLNSGFRGTLNEHLGLMYSLVS